MPWRARVDAQPIGSEVTAGNGEGHRRWHQLGLIGALCFFVIAVGLSYLTAHFLQRVGLGSILVETLVYFPPLILPLAYGFYPQVFTKRFWHFPPNSWAWIVGLALLQMVGPLFAGHLQPPVPKRALFGVIIISPVVEEIVRAVLISPLLERWGRFSAIIVASSLIVLVHPVPQGVLIATFAQSIMFVATDRSVPATAIAHSIMNAIVFGAAELRR